MSPTKGRNSGFGISVETQQHVVRHVAMENHKTSRLATTATSYSWSMGLQSFPVTTILSPRGLERAHLVSSVGAQGYAIIPGLFTNGEMNALLESVRTSGLSLTKAGIRHVMRCEAVWQLAWNERLMSLARVVLGDNAVPFRAPMFDKSPNSNWLVVWHQDTALPLRERENVAGWGPWSLKDSINYAHAPADALEQILAIRVHLDESTSGNGPLRVLPGTHCHGVLNHKEIHDLSASIAPMKCTVRKGGIVLMRPLLVHSSSKSTSSASRRVLHIEYAATLHFAGELELMTA